MRIKHKDAVAGALFVSPCMIGFITFFAGPFIASLYYCFTKGIGTVEYVGLENFVSLLNSKSFRLAAINTLKFNIVSVPFIIIVSLIFAILLNTKLKGVGLFRMIFIMPLVIPVASIILVWQIMFQEYGFINSILNRYGFITIDWINTRWSFYILVLIYTWKNCGYNIVLFLAGLNNIPKEYYEAAFINGAGKLKCFTKITFLYLAPTTFFVFVISIINSFKVFREAYLIAGSYPHSDMYMLQHFMNNNFFNLNYQRLSTAAFLMLIVIVLLVFLLYRTEEKLSKNF